MANKGEILIFGKMHIAIGMTATTEKIKEYIKERRKKQ